MSYNQINSLFKAAKQKITKMTKRTADVVVAVTSTVKKVSVETVNAA
jgi:hypothetical protein